MGPLNPKVQGLGLRVLDFWHSFALGLAECADVVTHLGFTNITDPSNRPPNDHEDPNEVPLSSETPI